MKIWVLVLALISGSLSAEDDLISGKVPESPNDAVYDPDQWLTGDSRADIVRNISIAKSKWQAEIFVVILSSSPKVEEGLLARNIAEKWGSGKLWGLAMHVVGDPESPRFFSGRKDSFGWNQKQEDNFNQSLERAMGDVRSRAYREEDQRLQVQTGVRELCDELGYLGLVMARIDKRYDRARGENLQVVRKKESNRGFLKKLMMVLIPLFLLLGAIVVFLLRKKRSESKVDFFFPETSHRRRFLAPWSGGADVIVKVGSRLREDGSRKG